MRDAMKEGEKVWEEERERERNKGKDRMGWSVESLRGREARN